MCATLAKVYQKDLQLAGKGKETFWKSCIPLLVFGYNMKLG